MIKRQFSVGIGIGLATQAEINAEANVNPNAKDAEAQKQRARVKLDYKQMRWRSLSIPFTGAKSKVANSPTFFSSETSAIKGAVIAITDFKEKTEIDKIFEKWHDTYAAKEKTHPKTKRVRRIIYI